VANLRSARWRGIPCGVVVVLDRLAGLASGLAAESPDPLAASRAEDDPPTGFRPIPLPDICYRS
jgi:hypothetical protein